ncbi:MAG: hypothetical protein ACXW20_07795 [Burkholderiales bacterium]
MNRHDEERAVDCCSVAVSFSGAFSASSFRKIDASETAAMPAAKLLLQKDF